MRFTAVLLVMLLGCQSKQSESQGATGVPVKGAKTTDDCKLFFEKARRSMTAMGLAAGVKYSPSIEAQALNDCRTDLAAGRRNPLIDCVLAARDEDGVQACFPRFDELTMPRAGSGSGSAAGSGSGSGAGSATGSGSSH